LFHVVSRGTRTLCAAPEMVEVFSWKCNRLHPNRGCAGAHRMLTRHPWLQTV